MTTKSAQCSKIVHHPGDFWANRRCALPMKIVEDGEPYCTIHAPSYVKAKRAQWQADADAIDAKMRDNAHRIECYPELLAALERAAPYLKRVSHNEWASSRILALNGYSENNPALYERILAVLAKANGVLRKG